MFKLSLSGLAFYLGILSSFAQNVYRRDSSYKPRPLRLEEINIVSSYYSQDGNHSAVTGGIGSERLTDQSNVFELKLIKPGVSGKKHHFSLGLGYDTYSSASSDKIDTATTWSGHSQTGYVARSHRSDDDDDHNRNGISGASTGNTRISIFDGKTITSASFRDSRIYPSLGWSLENSRSGLTVGAGLSFSTEYDYFSKGASFLVSKSSKNRNTELGLRLNAFFDTWLVIYPAELRPVGYAYGSEEDKNNLDRSPRNTYSAGFTWNQVIHKKLQIGLMAEPSFQEGLLGTTYQRVYFENGFAHPELLPSRRLKFPIGIRASYFLGDHVVLRPYYRFYRDSWNLTAHTFNLEAALKAGPSLTFIPFYRYYKQNGIPYFAPYKGHQAGDPYYTSDFDLSALTSQQFGLGLRIVPKNGVLGFNPFKSAEIRFAHYQRSTDLKSNILTVALNFK